MIFLPLRESLFRCLFASCAIVALSCVGACQESVISSPPPVAPAAGLNSGDTAWILVATALVLFMNIPGLALFYAGLVRTKNVLSILMQCFVLTAVISILWTVFGYSLAFSTSGMKAGQTGLASFVGGLDKCFLSGVGVSSMTGTIPEALFVIFQMTFAVITPALIVGAFAERIKFTAMLWFSILWTIFIYLPFCHMTWSGAGGLFFDWGVIDLAGGIVVHITAGFSALAACIMVGSRKGYPHRLDPPHNLTMTITGTAMLWVGWFGFNGGSVLAANGNAAMTILVTHLSACASTIVWMAIEWIKLGKPSALGAATGSIAGLAAVTPASGVVGPIGAIVIGCVSSAVCFVFATKIKRKFQYDDSLDVFGVHGVGGFIGTVLAGVFASSSLGGLRDDIHIGNQVMVQLMAAVITAIASVVVTVIIFSILRRFMDVRVSSVAEDQGLDLSEHEERGYNFN